MAPKPFTTEERIQRAREIGIIVDHDDEWVLSIATWRINKDGYAQCTWRSPYTKQTVSLHHFLVGVPLPPYEVDHKDRNKLNNSRVNLHYVTHGDNMRNTDWLDNSANWDIRGGRYHVRVTAKGVRHYIGSFVTQHEAEQARDAFISKFQDGDA
jgi:hypothetical protein